MPTGWWCWRAGLLRGSFVPPTKLCELRVIAHQRQKLVGQLASEKNRLPLSAPPTSGALWVWMAGFPDQPRETITIPASNITPPTIKLTVSVSPSSRTPNITPKMGDRNESTPS